VLKWVTASVAVHWWVGRRGPHPMAPFLPCPRSSHPNQTTVGRCATLQALPILLTASDLPLACLFALVPAA